MQIKVYNAEKFDRNRWRYVGFVTVFAIIFLLSILNQNIVGAILLCFLLGGYFYYSVSNTQNINISITKQGLIIGTKTYPWGQLTGFVLEVETKSQKIKNVVFVTRKGHSIHTFHDEIDNIKNFVVLLNDYLPMLGEYQQNFLEKLSRTLKL